MKFFKKISKKVLDFQARVILSIVFILVVPVFVLISKILIKHQGESRWLKWQYNSTSLDDLKKQF